MVKYPLFERFYSSAAELASRKRLKVVEHVEQFIVSEFKPIAEMQLHNQEMLRKPFMLSVEWKVSRPGWHSSLHVEARSEGQPYHEDQQYM